VGAGPGPHTPSDLRVELRPLSSVGLPLLSRFTCRLVVDVIITARSWSRVDGSGTVPTEEVEHDDHH
jgi:hypothetical protein